MTYSQPNAPQRNVPENADQSSQSSQGVSKLLMFGLIILALIASLLMLFFDSEVWLKIAVIAALWAALLGAILATRYSSQLDSAKDDARKADFAHRAELDREKAEHREREAKLAQEYQQRESMSRDEHIEALRSELVQMRIQLAKMSGHEFSGDEQAAVQAHAERIRELNGSSASSEVLNPTRNAANRDRENTVAPQATPVRGANARHSAQHSAQDSAQNSAQAGSNNNDQASSGKRAKPGSGAESFNTGTFAAIRWTGQDAEETAQIPLVVDTSSMDSQKVAEEKAERRGAHESAVNAPAGSEGSHRHRRIAEDEDNGGGRRRADESGGSLTVAELMNRFKKQ